MPETTTWAWVVNTIWPGFDPNNQNNLGSNGDFLEVDPSGYRNIKWFDPEGDDVINDADTDDASVSTADRVQVNGELKVVAEIARYNGTIVMVDGSELNVTMPVWLFTDGTWMVRLNDADIPPGKHYSQVTQITLGTFDGVDYSGTWISTRDSPFVCFTDGTLIATPDGPRPVETLRPGDLVTTLDHGPRVLRWIGRRTVAGRGPAAPVRIAAGTLGNDRDLVVSQQHRMLVSGWRAQLFAGSDEVLVAARHLVNGDTIRIAPCAQVTYVHLLFDRHEIVLAEGAPSESFHPGTIALTRLDEQTRDELLSLFPELVGLGAGGKTARPCVSAWEGRAIAAA